MNDSFDPISTVGSGSGADSLPSAADSSTVQLPTIELSTLVTFIKKYVDIHLEGPSNHVHPNLINLLDHSSSQEKLRRFITDPQVASIIIQKFSSKGKR